MASDPIDGDPIDFDEFRRAYGSDAVLGTIDEAAYFGFDPEAGLSTAPPQAVKATPYECRDPAAIPLRPWIYGRQLLRGSVSVIVSPGAVGKTALTVGMALAMATGRALFDKTVWEGPKRVWLWNLEDSGDELARLIEAARLHWGIAAADIAGRLFVDSGLDGAGLCVATEDHTGFRIIEPLIEALVDELKGRGIDVLVVDPFVSSHGVSENNNGAIDAIAKMWARVAVRANCAIVLVHHTRKLNGVEVSAEGARGASALPNAARSVLALNRMSTEEASQWGIEGDDRRRFFRAYDDKNNRAPPASASDWYRLASVDLGNGDAHRPGDSIQVVLPWSPPDAFAGITTEHLREIQIRLGAEGAAARKDPQSQEWAGETVAMVLGLDVSDKKGADAKRVKMLLKTWEQNKVIVESEERDEKSKPRKFLRPGQPVQPDDSPP
jgi:hypothetical protein